MGTLGLQIDLWRPGIGPQKHVNFLLSLNVDRKRFVLFIVYSKRYVLFIVYKNDDRQQAMPNERRSLR